ncbi:MAG: hypothetical protein V1849_05585 [Chloroflexota bacterium]
MRKLVLITAVLLAVLGAALVTNFVLLWRLLFLSLLVVLVSYLWSFFGIRGIEIQTRPLPQRCRVGSFSPRK